MQAPENSKTGAHEQEDDTGVPGEPEHSEVAEGGAGVGDEGAVAQEGPQDEEAPQGPAVGEDVSASDDGNSESGSRDFNLLVLFQDFLDAEIACMLLVPFAQSLAPGVHRVLTVNGNSLHILLAAEDSHLLQDSIAALLNELSTMLPLLESFQS